MPTPNCGGLLTFLLRAAPAAPDADADLLDRFVRLREEAAFAAIVRIHRFDLPLEHFDFVRQRETGLKNVFYVLFNIMRSLIH